MTANETLNAEAIRITKSLPDMEIGSEKYMATLSTLERLLGIKAFAAEAIEEDGAPAPMKIVDLHPVEDPFPEPEEVKTEAPAVETAPEEKTYSKEEVRAALGEARRKGVNITEILKSFGVDSFPALPAGKYGAVMEKLNA